eukprot:3952205-Pyramimonas_sp.AAC.1
MVVMMIMMMMLRGGEGGGGRRRTRGDRLFKTRTQQRRLVATQVGWEQKRHFNLQPRGGPTCAPRRG